MMMISHYVEDPHVQQKRVTKNEFGNKGDYINFVCFSLKLRNYKNFSTYVNIIISLILHYD